MMYSLDFIVERWHAYKYSTECFLMEIVNYSVLTHTHTYIYIYIVLYFINDPMFSDLISSLGLVAKKSGIFTAVLPL